MGDGSQAEADAESFLKNLGYSIIHRNFRCKLGEIDIIARDDATVVFVEVKSRASSSFGLAQEFVSVSKRRKLIKAAFIYIQQKRLDCPMRFDVVAFNSGAVEHIPGAFTTDGL